MKQLLAALVVTLSLAGCVGEVRYDYPQGHEIANNKTVSRPIDEAWASAVPNLSKAFFVINNLDKASGLINLSYSGDPEKYVDCGEIHSYVKNARGARNYDFPGSRAQQSYELMVPSRGLFGVTRQMSLEGRINLVFESPQPGTTRVTANVHYVLTKHIEISNVGGALLQSSTQTISFTSDAGASFPATDQQTTRCMSTGRLEAEILSAVR